MSFKNEEKEDNCHLSDCSTMKLTSNHIKKQNKNKKQQTSTNKRGTTSRNRTNMFKKNKNHFRLWYIRLCSPAESVLNMKCTPDKISLSKLMIWARHKLLLKENQIENFFHLCCLWTQSFEKRFKLN